MSTVHSAHYMARHIKVLVLHGWGQDGTMGQRALHHLTMHLAMAGIHLSFTTAPHKLPAESFAAGRDPHCWWYFTDNPDDRWNAPTDFLSASLPCFGWQQSVEAIRCVWLTEGPFQAILGFSQGAAMTHLLASLQHLQCTNLLPTHLELHQTFYEIYSNQYL